MEKNRADTPLRIAPWASSMAQLAERQCGARRHLRPVGIIGPGDGDPRVCEAAYRVARALAQAGMSIVNGGRGGVMAAASRGARDGGGIAIGLLPEDDDRNANEWLSVAVATGMGEMRNALVARSAVACRHRRQYGHFVGNGAGPEVGTPVFVMHGDVALPGAVQVRDVDEMLVRISAHLLA